MADSGALDADDLAAPFAQLPAALKALQDRAVAEAVAQAGGLLRDHYALYHRATGGAGGLITIADRVVAGGAQTQSLRLPASGTIADAAPDATYLLLVGQARARLKPPTTGTVYAHNVWVSYNDDPIDGAGSLPSPFYCWGWHAHDYYNSVHAAAQSTSDVGVQLGYCASEDAPAGAATHYRADFPNFAGTAFRTGCVFQAILHGEDENSRTGYTGGGYRRGTGAITSLTVFTNQAAQFDAGTRWTLFGA